MTDLLIADEIARGGMGTVRLAFRRTGDFGRALALKRPSGGGPGDSSERELLLEARLNAMLRHPNIVEVLDVGVDDRGLYLVMDYVEGITLRELPRLPAQLAWHVVAQVALALHAAHSHVGDDGEPSPVVHRDVSPANVMVGFDGSVRLMDFGLARSARDPLTQRYLRGTPGYISPEALRFDALTSAADVFQLAVVAHELLAGRRLYDDDDLRVVARRILDEPAPELGEGSEEAREILRAGLSKEPAERPTALAIARHAESERRALVRQEGPQSLADWLEALLSRDDGPLSAQQREALTQTVEANAHTAPALQTADHFRAALRGIDDGGDRAQVARLAGLPEARVLPEAYRLVTPCSPHRAAEIDGIAIDPERLALPAQRPLVVEGAGGALVPLGGDLLYADMFARWGLPTIVVARTALGTPTGDDA